MENPGSGQLNPDWVAWLMGFPYKWADLNSKPQKCGYDPHHYDVEPDIPRVVKDSKNRKQQIKGYGNAVDPMQIYPILKAIADIEKGCYE